MVFDNVGKIMFYLTVFYKINRAGRISLEGNVYVGVDLMEIFIFLSLDIVLLNSNYKYLILQLEIE